MTCPDENTFLRYLAGRLSEAGRSAMDAHLDDCPACRKVFSSMAVTEHTGDAFPEPTEVLGGRYRIGEPLGQGGAGQVYAAEHLGTGRRCAVKFLSDAAAADPEAVERFSREARILGGLEHRGIVSILDFAEAEDGRPYLVMDYLEGEDLATRLGRQGGLAWPVAQRIFRQVCQALREAHAHGVLHRDLKPSNIFLTPGDDGRDRAVLLDFGLAKHHALAEPSLTRTGAILGTPAYMSPEQARGRPADERSDVYSLAAVLYQMLTGEAPFRGSTFTDVLAQVLTDPPAPLATRTREPAPTALDAVIQTAMAKDPAERYASVADLERAVLAAGGPPAFAATAATVATAAAPRKSRHRRPAVWLLIAGAAALAIGLGVYWLQPPPRSETDHDTARSTAKPMRPPAGKALPDAQAAHAMAPTRPDAAAKRPRPRGPHRLARRPPSRKRPRSRAAAMAPGSRMGPMGRSDPYITVFGMDGKPVLRRLSQLPPAQRALIRINAYISRKDWKTCARIARKAPQTRRVLYYSIYCYRMMGDTQRTRKLCRQWHQRFPKRWGRPWACRNVGHELRTPPVAR